METHKTGTYQDSAIEASQGLADGGVALPLGGKNGEVFTPPFPHKLEDLDVSVGFLTDLALKAASLDPDCTTASVADRLRLGKVVTDIFLQRLYEQKLVDKKGTVALHNHRYAMTERGWVRVAQLMSLSTYIGAAPVSLEYYTKMLVRQIRSRPPVTKQALDEVLVELVLSDTVKRRLGVVATSGRSLFLSGPPGNGKTAMARALVNAIGGEVWIPYAIEVDSQIIRLFDKHNHYPVEQPAEEDFDHRWVKVKPPLVTVGGELTIQSLDLTATETPRYYEAPFQLKANGGVLVIDDLGRQRISAGELLNRWIVPLEYRTDYLTLSTGKKIQVPFELIVIFATNLTDVDLVDEAFMRRMGYRLYVSPPSPETYAEIFRRFAQTLGLTADERLIGRMLSRYKAEGRVLKCCDPRDLLLRALDLCKFDNQALQLTDKIMDEAWDGYFGGVGFPSQH
jgi:hypothetical protein